tara:strand:- start:28 stop:375 length:348 start_codon:yes stop_codon:yes gene_type:complete
MANIDTLYRSQFGQYGSVFTSVSGALTPPTNKVFVAIQMINDTTFDTNGGLIADATQTGVVYPSTLDGSGNAVYAQLYGGDAVDVNDSFKAGTTITGRWTEIDITEGAIIAYIGD